ncbi:aldehyde dehydrogenase family protein [Halovenus rubra]|uniref:Aldehyde dehydrogenase family protein n=2 Tax=Halovenus rubra TaxID=869890 RepID=A0ACC7DXR7_9EURY|nr:aldehyde dehydrogenase family protein [Halovenus rubra]
MTNTYGNYIDGEWQESASGETVTVHNPADVTETIGEFQYSSAADVTTAVTAATEAQTEWADRQATERGDVLRRVAEEIRARSDELAETLTREEGKTVPEAAGEVSRAIDILYYYAERVRDFGHDKKASSTPDKDLSVVREPVGVAGLITAWNYPFVIPVWKMAPAIATGNAVVFKPASNAPNCTRKLFECFDEAGVPDGVVNYVTGSGSEVGNAILEHDAVDAVSFTGSKSVGYSVYDGATEDMKRVQTEMGGKNPLIVSDTADMERALSIARWGAFGVTGQACTATSRAIVYEDVYDEFVEGIVERAEDIDVGHGLDGADMGPQASEGELEGTLDYIDVGVTEGARLATGGEELAGGSHEDGYFVEPTVFTDVDHEMRIAQEEIFGPVLAVLKVSGYEEALEVANDVDYGLSASIATQDLAEAKQFADDIESGIVKINEQTSGTELHVPFGGFKDSSSNTYRESGDEGLRFFTSTKTIYENW